MSHFDDSVPQLIKMLNNLNGWIDEAVAHSEAQGTNPEDLIQLKLIDVRNTIVSLERPPQSWREQENYIPLAAPFGVPK